MAKGMPWIRAYTSIRTDPRSLILGRLLSDSHAYTRILDLRLWLADNAPDGVVRGPHAEVVVEEAVGWRGEPGAFANAARDSGFLRANPARDSDGISLVDEDWAAEQAAHLAKLERDRSKPDGRRKSRAAPVRDSSGESRELRVEKKEETSSAVADAPPAAELELVPVEPPKRKPGKSNACGEFIDWFRAETRKQLAADAPDNCRMETHQAARLGEAVKLHGLETCKAAVGLWMGWEGSRAAGYPLGMFAAKWEGWVGRVKAPSTSATTTPRGSPDDERARALREAVAESRRKQAAGEAS